MSGTAYGIGVGPGDPELLTVKAARILARVPVIAYPQSAEGESLARSIAAPFIPHGAVELPFLVPFRKERESARCAYDAAAEAIATRLDDGLDVAVLCEGDPFFYGSFMYLFERLSRGHEVRVVPGVTSLTASAAALGRPLAARNDVLKVIPAPLDANRLAAEIGAADAVAILKVGRHFEKVRGILRELGLAERAFLVTAASSQREQVAPLDSVADGVQPYFSTILLYKGAEHW
jgi:precorrin-2/cobalt-factor-2 C20-methyltransferase